MINYEDNFLKEVAVNIGDATSGIRTWQLTLQHAYPDNKFYILIPRDTTGRLYLGQTEQFPCHSSCNTCGWDKTSKGCLSCNLGQHLKDGSCGPCPSTGWFIDDAGVCTKCDDTCMTCSGKKESCLTCSSWVAEKRVFKSENQGKLTCSTECKENEYQDFSNSQCTSCDQEVTGNLDTTLESYKKNCRNIEIIQNQISKNRHAWEITFSENIAIEPLKIEIKMNVTDNQGLQYLSIVPAADCQVSILNKKLTIQFSKIEPQGSICFILALKNESVASPITSLSWPSSKFRTYPILSNSIDHFETEFDSFLEIYTNYGKAVLTLMAYILPFIDPTMAINMIKMFQLFEQFIYIKIDRPKILDTFFGFFDQDLFWFLPNILASEENSKTCALKATFENSGIQCRFLNNFGKGVLVLGIFTILFLTTKLFSTLCKNRLLRYASKKTEGIFYDLINVLLIDFVYAWNLHSFDDSRKEKNFSSQDVAYMVSTLFYFGFVVDIIVLQGLKVRLEAAKESELKQKMKKEFRDIGVFDSIKEKGYSFLYPILSILCDIMTPVIIYNLNNFSLLNILFIEAFIFTKLAFLALNRPHKKSLHNWIQFSMELLTGIAMGFYSLLIFKRNYLNEMQKYRLIGYPIVLLLSTVILINVIILVCGIKKIWRFLIYLKKTLCPKKTMTKATIKIEPLKKEVEASIPLPTVKKRIKKHPLKVYRSSPKKKIYNAKKQEVEMNVSHSIKKSLNDNISIMKLAKKRKNQDCKIKGIKEEHPKSRFFISPEKKRKDLNT